MIEPTLSLAFSVRSNSGVYALLLGSGVSRSARIPTGWEVVLDLIRQLAHLTGEDCEPKPDVWYQNKYGEEADYSKLLDALAKLPSERNQLLKNYFEATAEELKEDGVKVPTQAHKAIAKLVESGYIKVIITTNFDRLIETALENIGITPTVISTPDATEGALPLPHSRCTIIKVHGDYLDTRIKNTPTELEEYDDRLNRLLDRVFDEYGLIICGWSGLWDTALRDAIKRCPSRRFTTFWAARSAPKGIAKELVDWRKGVFVKIQDSDSFFQELKEKVVALEEISQPHPLSVKAAVATLKAYLVDDTQRIRLHDLVNREVEKLFSEISIDKFPLHINLTEEQILDRLKRYEALAQTLISLMITGCYWGEELHHYLWVTSLTRIANVSFSTTSSYFKRPEKIRLYPALLLLYSSGIAALSGQKYETLIQILRDSKTADNDGSHQLLSRAYSPLMIEENVALKLPGINHRYSAFSDYLCNLLREPFRDILPDGTQYLRSFDIFECLLFLIQADIYRETRGSLWIQPSRFIWRSQYQTEDDTKSQLNELESVIDFCLEQGFFGGSEKRYLSVRQEFDKKVSELRTRFY